MRELYRRLLDEIAKRRPGFVSVPEPAARIAAAEERWQTKLPEDYRAFLLEVGRVDWPTAIGSPIDFEVDGWPARFIPFARQHDRVHGFFEGSRIESVPAATRELPTDLADEEEEDNEVSFEAWLEATMDEAFDEEAFVASLAAEPPAEEPPSESEEELELRPALDLLDRLVASGSLETEAGFDEEACARQLRAAWGDAERMLDALTDMPGVVEVFASEDDLESLLAD